MGSWTRAPVAVAIAASGCIEVFFDPIEDDPPPDAVVVVEESFVQDEPPAVDLLIVMDDTPSMGQKQEFVAENLPSLLDQLDAAGVAWQVGVVSTDPAGGFAGWLVGNPWILTPGAADREAAFAALLTIGTDGAGPESGLAMAARALDLAAGEGPNRGFRRTGAVLHVLFVSDADDHSEPASPGEDPSAALRAHFAAALADSGFPARASAVVGLPPDGCTSPRGSAQAADRYVALAEETGGLASSICAPDLAAFSGTLADVAIAWRREFPLRALPDGEVLVLVDGIREVGFVVDEGVLVFDHAPAPGSIVKVSYPVALAETTPADGA